MGILVLAVLAVLIFIGLKNKKKLDAEQQKAAAEKAAAEKAAEQKAIAENLEKIKADCAEVINKVAASCDEYEFASALNEKEKKYCFSKAREIFQKTIQEMYFEGNDTVKIIMFKQLIKKTRNRVKYLCTIGRERPISHVSAFVAAIAIRALHFEKYGKNREEYRSITEEECREFITNCEKINCYVSMREILGFVEEVGGKYEYLPYPSEYYYADSLCNGVWKWIAEKYENGESTDPNVVFEILFLQFKLTDAEVASVATERERLRQLKEIDKQCIGCSQYYLNGGSCSLKRANCPSFIAK